MTNPLTLEHVRDLLLKVVDLEWGEEPQGAEVEGHDGRHRLLEEGGRVQQGPVAAQTHDEVDLVRQVVLALGEGHQLVLE